MYIYGSGLVFSVEQLITDRIKSDGLRKAVDMK